MVLLSTLLALALVAAAQANVIQPFVDPPPPADPQVCANVQGGDKFDCFPEDFANEDYCKARGCCWVPAAKALPFSTPWCFYPPGYKGYKNSNVSSSGATLTREISSPYSGDVTTLKLEIDYQTDQRVRVKIYDANNGRFEAPYPKIPPSTARATKARIYDVKIDEATSGFSIVRSNGDVVFDGQGKGGFIFADQFIQFSAKILGDVYGLGEHRTAFQLNSTWSRYVLVNHDRWPQEDINLYGSHPFYLAMEPSGNSHGVLLNNYHPAEITLQPGPQITYRHLGGIFDFYFFLGPSPSEVITQYTELVGRPIMPPYWSLGFHLCRYGYKNIDTLKATWQRTRDSGIPFDVQWTDIDYMITQNDFTVDPVNFAGLKEFVENIQSLGMHYMTILDPGVSASEPAGTYPAYDRGLEQDVFVKNQDGSVFIGHTWNPVSTAYPDFFHPNALNYWSGLMNDLHDILPYDGMWIDMNEPSNFLDGTENGCPDLKWDNPPYTPALEGGKLYYKTLCMSAKHVNGLHYDLHNLYGIAEADVTYNSLLQVRPNKRPFVLSRASSPGIGRYAGHWGGDNGASWNDLTKSVPELLSFSIYGVSFMGSDICGFRDNSNAALCNRWMQLGAFYPFSRNHNGIDYVEQDPVAMGDQVIASSKKALNIRYTLLPYLYTLLYRANVYGETVGRPLFFEFPSDKNTYGVDRSFFWGSGLYIVPVTEEGSTSVSTYLPAGRWYDYYTQEARDSVGAEVVLDAPIDTIPLLLKGGNILPTQAPAQTTTEARKNQFSLLVVSNADGTATGSLFWDDGESLETIENDKHFLAEFNLSDNSLTSTVQKNNYDNVPNLDGIKILGQSNVNSVSLNGQSVEYNYDSSKKILSLTGLNLNFREDFTLKIN